MTRDEDNKRDLVVDGGEPNEEKFAGAWGVGKAVRFGRVAGNPLPITDNTDAGTFPTSFYALIS